MESYERIFVALFGQHVAARIAFVLLVILVVGVPYVTRTWRELYSTRAKLDLQRQEVEILKLLLEISQATASPEEQAATREIVHERLRHLLASTSLPKSSDKSTETNIMFQRLRALSATVGIFFAGGVVAVLPAIFIPGLGVFWTVGCIIVGLLLMRGTQTGPFFAGLTFVPLVFLLVAALWELQSQSASTQPRIELRSGAER
jgi:hypothetical protein